MVLPVLAGATAALVAAALAPEVTKTIRKEVLETPEARAEAKKFKGLEPAAIKGFQAVERKTGIEGFIPGIQGFDYEKQKTFVNEVQKELKKRNPKITDVEANRVANYLLRTELRAGASGELFAILGLEAAAERVGVKVAAKEIPKTVARQELTGGILKGLLNPVARGGAKGSAVGGVLEGAGAVMVEDVSRKRFGRQEEALVLKVGEKGSSEARALAQIERSAIGGIAGGAVAGTTGLVISGQAIPRKKVSQAVDVAASVLDPFEKPGEALERLIPGRTPPKRIRITEGVPTPSTTKPRTRVKTLTDLFVPGRRKQQVVSVEQEKRIEKIIQEAKQKEKEIRTTPSIPSKTGRVKTLTLTDILKSNVPTDTSVPSKEETSSKEDIPSKDDEKTKEETKEDEKTKEETSTPTQSTSVSATVPTTSAIFRGGLPLLPLGIPGGGGRGRGGRRGRVRFVDELKESQRVLRNILGRNSPGRRR